MEKALQVARSNGIAGPLNFDYERYSTEALLPKVSRGIGTLSLLIFQLFCSNYPEPLLQRTEESSSSSTGLRDINGNRPFLWRAMPIRFRETPTPQIPEQTVDQPLPEKPGWFMRAAQLIADMSCSWVSQEQVINGLSALGCCEIAGHHKPGYYRVASENIAP